MIEQVEGPISHFVYASLVPRRSKKVLTFTLNLGRVCRWNQRRHTQVNPELTHPRNDKVKKQAGATTVEFSIYVEAITFTKVSGLLSWTRKQKESVLLILSSDHLLQLCWFHV